MTQENYENLLIEELTRLRACNILIWDSNEEVALQIEDVVNNLEKLLGLQVPSNDGLMERVREIIVLEDIYNSGMDNENQAFTS